MEGSDLGVLVGVSHPRSSGVVVGVDACDGGDVAGLAGSAWGGGLVDAGIWGDCGVRGDDWGVVFGSLRGWLLHVVSMWHVARLGCVIAGSGGGCPVNSDLDSSGDGETVRVANGKEVRN